MSTSPTPVTPPTYSSLSNPSTTPTTALVALMQQSLQQNSAMMTQFHSRPPPTSSPQPLSHYQYKPQRPSFPKFYGMTPTNSLFLANFATYKSEAFYSRFHDWMRTTPANTHLSFAISSDIIASLPSSVSSMFLNYARFASDRIAILYSLLTQLNPSSI